MKVINDPDVDEFILSLQAPAKSKVMRMIELLENFGHQIGSPYSKKVADGLFELRIRGTQEVRIFYAFHQNAAYLLHGFVKKSQKIPPNELKKAIRNKSLLTGYNQ